MQISVAVPGELGQAEISAWHRMQAQNSSLANPFLSPEFAIAAGRHQPGTRVAVLTDGPAIAGFFPFERRALGLGVPIVDGLTDAQGLVHAPGVDWDPPALLRACQVSRWKFDHLVADQRPFQPYFCALVPSPVIDLTDGFPAYQQRLRENSPQFWQNLCRKTRKLEREAGDLRFEPDSHDPAGLRVVMRWKSAQYHRNGWVDVFERPWVTALIEDLFRTRGAWCSGQLSLLYAGDTPVAGHFGIRSRRMLAHWFPSYNTAFARQSPGLIHQLRLAEATAGLGIGLIDLGTGMERYKKTLRSRDLLVAEGVVARDWRAASLHRAGATLSGWARREARRHPPLKRAADRVLRHYGRVA